jgi:UDP-glucose:glycoprotein glucosyltransferase
MSLVKRGIPLRWGLVPQTLTSAAAEQAKIVYYLKDAYGLSAMTNYLQAVRPPFLFLGEPTDWITGS